MFSWKDCHVSLRGAHSNHSWQFYFSCIKPFILGSQPPAARSPPKKSLGNLQFIHHSFQQKYQKDLIEWYMNIFGSQIKLPKRNLLLLLLHQTTCLKGICVFLGVNIPTSRCFFGGFVCHWFFLCRSFFFYGSRIRSWVTLGRWSSSAPQQLTRHPVEPSPRPFSRPRDHVTSVGWIDGWIQPLFFLLCNYQHLGIPGIS